MEDLIKEFLSHKRFAVVGASNRPEKYGNRIVRDLKEKSFEVYPINPHLKEVEGLTCYPDLASVPVKVDVVDIVVPPSEAEKVVRQAKALGIERIWLQPGAESEAVIQYCKEHGLKVVYGLCVMRVSAELSQ